MFVHKNNNIYLFRRDHYLQMRTLLYFEFEKKNILLLFLQLSR